jgi:hypothetical protein
MSMQGFSSPAPARNASRAAAANLSSKISVGKGSKSAPSTLARNAGKAPPLPGVKSAAVRGFGGAKTPHSSTVNAVGGPVGNAPAKTGSVVRGFSGTGVMSGKV